MPESLNQKIIGLARLAINSYLESGAFPVVNPENYQEEIFRSQRGVFVTLYKHGELRGCIGNIEPNGPVRDAIISNSIEAAFNDPRFEPLKSEEFEIIDLEVSILTDPVELDYQTSKDLLNYLETNKPGVVLSFQGNYSTFLPQVWEDVSSGNEFMEHLCLKAGLSSDFWKNYHVNIEVYDVEAYS